MKKKGIKITIFLIIICLLFMIKPCNAETIDKMIIDENGLINNKYFNILKNAQTEEEAFITTQGINEAIKYAYNHNIRYIKLEEGRYVIDVVNTEIILKSNIKLDLNNSIIKAYPNVEAKYNLIHIYNVENVEVTNGTLQGDKNDRNWAELTGSTFEQCMGIRIENARNVKISALEIYDMNGDGILVHDDMDENKMRTKNIHILNNDIHDIRRNGIGIIAVDTLNIIGNSIHDIKGTAPQDGICIERDSGNQFYKNVTITNNKIYNHVNPYSIIFFDTAYNFIIENKKVNILFSLPLDSISYHSCDPCRMLF